MTDLRGWSRVVRVLPIGTAGGLFVAAVGIGALAYARAEAAGQVGGDLALYLDATRRWLGGGEFYPAYQVAGAYAIVDGAILYPPTTIPLFAAFLVLPVALFWVLPLGAVAWVVIRHRPAIWSWPLMALCLLYLPTTAKIVHGNPFMWAAAGVALGTVYGWPALLVLVKPSLAPLALVGAWDRRWWIGLAAVVVAGAAFGSLWLTYLTVLANSSNPNGVMYSLADVPLLLVPLIAWLARSAGRVPAVAVEGRQALEVGTVPAPQDVG